MRLLKPSITSHFTKHISQNLSNNLQDSMQSFPSILPWLLQTSHIGLLQGALENHLELILLT